MRRKKHLRDSTWCLSCWFMWDIWVFNDRWYPITTIDLCKSWANILKELCMRQNKDCLCQLWYCLSCVFVAIQPIFPCCKRLRQRRRGRWHVSRLRMQHQDPRCQWQHPIHGTVFGKCLSLKGMTFSSSHAKMCLDNPLYRCVCSP